MPGITRLLPVLALLPLPLEVQLLIARVGTTDTRRALATSAHVDGIVLDSLALDPDRDTHHAALRRSTDTAVLHARLDRGPGCCTVNVLRNPAVDPQRLTEALREGDRRHRLAAYVNPATPAVDRDGLDAATVTSLVDVGEPVGSTVVRSHEALLTNRALLTQIADFGPVLRRAAFALPDLTIEQYEMLKLHGSTGRYGGRHPVSRTRCGAQAMDVEELLSLRSPAADLWLTEAPGTDVVTAARLMSRPDHHVEPYIIARLLDRFGAAFIPSGAEHVIAGTRVISTAWSNPAGHFYNDVVTTKTLGLFDRLVDAVIILDGNLSSWENFLALSSDWDGDADTLAHSARAL
jgi:hypothetical protein